MPKRAAGGGSKRQSGGWTRLSVLWPDLSSRAARQRLTSQQNEERRRKPMPTTFAILAAIYCLVVAPIAVALAPSDRRPQSAPAARRSAKAHT